VYALAGIVALPLLGGVIFGLLIALIVQIPMNRAVDTGYRASNQRYAMMVESVNALETVKATGSESELQSRMENCVRESAKVDGKGSGISQTGMNLLALVQNLTTTLIVVVAYFQVARENMSLVAMIACVILAGRAMAPLNMFASQS
jgi:ATP-binding cassette subfamily C protein LapB